MGEDVLLDGDDGGEEVSEEDEDEAADQKGEDDQGTRYNLTNKHYLQKRGTAVNSDTFWDLQGYIILHMVIVMM